MSGDSNPYPVGLIYVGATGQQEQTDILPFSDDPGKASAGGVSIKQEKPDDMQLYVQSCSTVTQGNESAVPGGSGVAIKQEFDDNDLSLSAEGQLSANQVGAVNEKDKEVEDRNSETYWEKRKRFTLAFAAGLRKFIQMHPELLRYGPKKSQGGASATVTSSGVAGEEEEEAMEEEVEPSAPVATRSPRGRSQRGRRGRGASAATRRAATEPVDTAYTPTTRKRGRSARSSKGASEDEAEQEESFDIAGGVTIKTEPLEDED